MALDITELKGISTSAVYEDGDMYDCVNLEKRTGLLKPTCIKFNELADYSNIDGDIVQAFKHNSTESCNKMLFITSTGKLYANTTLLATNIPAEATINAVGNIVSIAATSGMRYYICQSGTYTEVILNTDTIADLVELRVSLHQRSGGIELLQIRGEYVDKSKSNDDLYMRDLAKAMFARARAKVTELGYLQDFHLAITAVELYDGSVVMHSVPVLLGQAYDVAQRYDTDLRITPTGGQNKVYYKHSPLVLGQAGTNLDAIGDNQVDYADYSSFAGNPTRIHGGVNGGETDIGTSLNKLNYAPFALKYDISTAGTIPVLYAYQNELQYRFKKGLDSNNAQLIKSINVYLTAAASMFDINHTEDLIPTCQFTATLGVMTSNIRPLIRENKDIIDDLFASDFYKVAEIPITGAVNVSGDWHTLDVKRKIGANLLMQQTLPIDPGRHKISVSGGQYVYNNRLHLFNYSEELWKGFNVMWFEQNTGVGQFNAGMTNSSFNNSIVGHLLVELKVDNSVSRLIVPLTGVSSNGSPMQAVTGYPDRRATKITINMRSTLSSYSYVRSYSLTPSKTHNFAYAIRDNLKTEVIPDQRGSITDYGTNSYGSILQYTNGIRVSEISNPFYFHPRNSYRIGSSGTVLRVGLNKMNISERNFGSFPLYAQNENSWYSLQQGTGEVVYSNVIHVSGDVATNKNILETPYGLIYVGVKGLYVLNNNKSELLTPHLQEPPLKLNIEQYSDMSAELRAMLNNTHNDFIDYLQNITSAIYDPLEDVIVLTNNTKAFSYVYSLLSKHLHRTDKLDVKLVENALTITNNQPTITLYDKKKTYTIERDRSGDNTTEILFVTRPAIHSSRDIKRLDRAILSAIVYAKKETELTFMLYASNDGVNFKLVRARTQTAPNTNNIVGYKDFDTLHLAGTKYRYYMYALYGTLAEKSEISLITSAVHKEYTNDKIR